MTTNPPITLLFNPTKVAGRNAGADGPAMAQIRKNTLSIDSTDRERIVKILVANYKSIPLTNVARIDDIVKKNVEKGGPTNKDTAATKQQEKDKEDFKKFLELLMNNVGENFRNWAVLLRAWEPELKSIVEEIRTKGQTTDRRITQRGFFVFFFTNEELIKWLTVQVSIASALAKKMQLSMRLSPVPVPKGKEGFKNLFNAPEKVARPSFGSAQVAFESLAAGKTQLSTAELIEVMVILTPGRAILTRDEIQKKVHDITFISKIRDLYDSLFNAYKVMFVFKPVKVNATDSVGLNEAYRELISAVRMSVGQYRIMLFGENEKLGANEKRRFTTLDITLS